MAYISFQTNFYEPVRRKSAFFPWTKSVISRPMPSTRSLLLPIRYFVGEVGEVQWTFPRERNELKQSDLRGKNY